MLDAVPTANQFKYDLAISCLAEDEPRAHRVYETLEHKVPSIFLYTENQKDAAGKDCAEFFTRTFGNEARVVLVIYRRGWGETKWTRVEEEAIRRICQAEGARRVLVCSLDSCIPDWLPPEALWRGEDGDSDGLARAVVERIVEHGGRVRGLATRPMTGGQDFRD